MTWTKLSAPYSVPVVVLGVIVCGALLAEAWLGYRATQEWQASSTLLVERRARESIDLLTTALSRDMRGVQATVLSSRDWSGRSFLPPYEVRAAIAGAFARYPYPESFFGWSEGSGSIPIIFIRANQPPPWLSSPIPVERYPVEIVNEPDLGRRIMSGLDSDIRAGRRHAVIELDIGGERYQIVTRLNFSDDAPEHLESAFGFMVNLRRARKEYFAGILQQVARLTDAGKGLDYSLIDDQGVYVVGPERRGRGEVMLSRQLPVLFLDPRQVTLPPSMSGSSRVWTVQVSAARDETLVVAAQGARRTRIVIASATGAAALGLFVAIRVARASIDFANMRSDFVSSVTHELKTPLSTIRGVAETLARGRFTSPNTVQRYSQLLMQESRRLIRLVDNLLAYARVTDVTEVYSFQPLEPSELVAAAMQGFPQLDRSFVEIDVPGSLPPCASIARRWSWRSTT